MWSDGSMDMNKNYEAPKLEVVGTLHEITKNGTAPNADASGGENNTAFNPGKSF